ncbi:hypothetical protein [Trinickia sp.]
MGKFADTLPSLTFHAVHERKLTHHHHPGHRHMIAGVPVIN